MDGGSAVRLAVTTCWSFFVHWSLPEAARYQPVLTRDHEGKEGRSRRRGTGPGRARLLWALSRQRRGQRSGRKRKTRRRVWMETADWEGKTVARLTPAQVTWFGAVISITAAPSHTAAASTADWSRPAGCNGQLWELAIAYGVAYTWQHHWDADMLRVH